MAITKMVSSRTLSHGDAISDVTVMSHAISDVTWHRHVTVVDLVWFVYQFFQLDLSKIKDL